MKNDSFGIKRIIKYAQYNNVERLDLSKIGLSEVPPGIGMLNSLRILDLGGNRINRLPPEILKLENLEDFYIRENYLTHLPEEIGCLHNLTNLWLSNNNIEYLPNSFFKLSNLKELYINNNYLSTIPPEIENLSALQELDLSWNNIKVLPKEIKGLKNLIIFKTVGNKFKEIPKEIIELPLLSERSLKELNDYKYQNLKNEKRCYYFSCFISYASEDTMFVELLFKDLRAIGIQCWYAPEDMKIGEKMRPTLHDAISKHDKLLLVLSKHSINSDWVEDEVNRAFELEKAHKKNMLLPVRIDTSIMKTKTGWPVTIRNSRNIGDFSNWRDVESYQVSFMRLLRDLEKNFDYM